MSHCIILIQTNPEPESRTYCDFNSVNECMESVCKMYENHLKRIHPKVPTITYDLEQLFDFIDQLYDASCLVLNKNQLNYSPYNKDWIKERIYSLLKRQAGV